MSLGVVIKGPEGMVLAADSRVTLEAKRDGGQVIPVNFDNVTKLLSFNKPHLHVGVVTYGLAVIGLRTAHGFIPEFEQKVLENKEKPLTVADYAGELSKFFVERWAETNGANKFVGPDMTFMVGGFDPGGAYGKVYNFGIPTNPNPTRMDKDNEFGMNWGGQLEVANRLIHGFDPRAIEIIKSSCNLSNDQTTQIHAALSSNLQYPIPYQVLPLQDCVDLAIFLIRTTIMAQRLAVGIRGVGGEIDVAVITRTKGFDFIKQKTVHG